MIFYILDILIKYLSNLIFPKEVISLAETAMSRDRQGSEARLLVFNTQSIFLVKVGPVKHGDQVRCKILLLRLTRF